MDSGGRPDNNIRSKFSVDRDTEAINLHDELSEMWQDLVTTIPQQARGRGLEHTS